jgi:pyroglutamyl-peptidase
VISRLVINCLQVIFFTSGIVTLAAAEKPVILLTGFEPFGEQRPPNPSWEGIAKLNDTEWQGYRLVSLQIPVIWGAPLKELEPRIQQLQPVAVFSFGQGAPGAFAIETKAQNQRGEIADNTGQQPPLPLIVGDGPTEFTSTFPVAKVADILKQKGLPIRISEHAGQYLCEETLYSLETLRRKSPVAPVVAFCHVPPLKSLIGEKPVDADYIQNFVLEFLGAWKTVSQEGPIQQNVSAAQKSAAASVQPANPERAAVEKLIENYFKSWSEQRMRDYGDCFADGAVIQEVGSGEIRTQMKDPFVTTQATYHKMAIFKAVEVPVRTAITFEADLARVVVYWKLTAGPRLQYGYDHFTLIRQKGEWKIVNLVFYSTKTPKE